MSGGSSVYLPLPQSNSDSEEELRSGSENHVINRPKPRLEAGQEALKTNYTHLGNDKDLERNNGSFGPSITVAKSLTNSPSRLSLTRKILFVLSILLCLVTIAVFLWALPCDLDPCPPALSVRTAKSWEAPLLDLELHGPISVVPRVVGKGKNLVLLAENPSAAEPRRHLILCLLGASGAVAWTQYLAREPLDVDCTLIDANKDGVMDCVIAGKHDLLKAIDPLSGLTVWDISSSKTPPIERTLFPVLIPDINGDGSRDLLSARIFVNPREHSQLILVSGATGEVLGKPFPSTSCVGISGLVFEKDFSVSYTCLDSNNKKSEQTIALRDLLYRADIELHQSWPAEELKDLPRTSEIDSGASYEARVGGWRLLLENRGHCSNSCSVSFLVRNKKNETVYNSPLEGAYAMNPVTMSFDKLSGFVLKFWQWHGRKGKRTSNATNSGSPDPKPSSLKTDYSVYREMKRRSFTEKGWEEVNERMVLITFNDTDWHVVNVSQQSVMIMCQNQSVCQPSPDSLQRSLLIADLDEDGSKELLSFSSSYFRDSTETGEARLQARVRVVRLEAELPQLFGTSNRL